MARLFGWRLCQPVEPSSFKPRCADYINTSATVGEHDWATGVASDADPLFETRDKVGPVMLLF